MAVTKVKANPQHL